MKKNAKKVKVTRSRMPLKSGDVPVNQRMLFGVRDLLRADIRSQANRLESQIFAVRAEISKQSSEFHRISLLIEEQNARNIIVLDGLTSLFDRQERIEGRVKDLEGN